MSLSFPASTFGHIYEKALQSQLKKVGTTLRLLRNTRQEAVTAVAAAIDLRPGILVRIENGEHNFRLKTLMALCDYYDTDVDSVIGQGELLHFKIA